MAQTTHIDDEDRTAEPDFYIPAGAGPSFVTSRAERVWTTLFNHQVGPVN